MERHCFVTGLNPSLRMWGNSSLPSQKHVHHTIVSKQELSFLPVYMSEVLVIGGLEEGGSEVSPLVHQQQRHSERLQVLESRPPLDSCID